MRAGMLTSVDRDSFAFYPFEAGKEASLREKNVLGRDLGCAGSRSRAVASRSLQWRLASEDVGRQQA